MQMNNLVYVGIATLFGLIVLGLPIVLSVLWTLREVERDRRAYWERQPEGPFKDGMLKGILSDEEED